jgi:hypothetical protein
LLRIYEKNPTQNILKIKSFFSGNPITVFVSPYNYFSITPIAMIFFSFPQSSFYKDYTLQFFFKSKQITISYDMTRFGRNPLWGLSVLKGLILKVKRNRKREKVKRGKTEIKKSRIQHKHQLAYISSFQAKSATNYFCNFPSIKAFSAQSMQIVYFIFPRRSK